MHRRWLGFLGWLYVVVALLPLPAAAQDPCENAGNLTFNCQFTSFGEAPGGQVAQGWWPYVTSGHPAFDQSTESPLAPAQRIWSDGEGFVAGIYQQVSGITPGATYQAYIGWFVFQSSGPEMGRSIGIDPNGGTDPNSAAVVWSPEVWEKKRLAPELVVRAVAAADRVTVFLRVNHPKTYGADQAFLDAVSLARDDSVPVVSAPPAATETPLPTATPAATETPLPTATAMPTDTPVAPPTATEAPPTSTAVPTASTASTTSTTTVAAPTATAEPTSTTTRTPTATATTAAPAATAWDLRGGTGVAQMAFVPAAAPQPLPAAAAVAAGGSRAMWPYVLISLTLVSAAVYGLARFSAGGRKRG
ncbi:MAG: hypothetical protein ACYC5O_03960 [Anaerolineae bacterium]